MNDQNSSNQSNNSLENILKELEERFGANSDQEEKSSKRHRGANFKHFTQSQIIGGLTLVLLVVGAAVGVYLGQTNQELRQQAQVAPYCVLSGGNCGGSDTCCSTNEQCIGSICRTPLGSCTSCVAATSTCPLGQAESTEDFCQIGTLPGLCCKAATGTPVPTATRTPTRTPTLPPGCVCTQNGQGSCGVAGGCPEGFRHVFYTCTPSGCGASDGCIPDATCNPTSTPVPPTNPPATNTPTRTPTPVPISATPAPTCNGITITFGTTTEPNRPVRIGDVITLTCGAIAGANRYEFRLGLNGNLLQNIAAAAAGSRVSQPFTIAQSGTYGAQCRMCTDSTATSCQPWETL